MSRHLLKDLIGATACLCPMPARARLYLLAWAGEGADLLHRFPTGL